MTESRCFRSSECTARRSGDLAGSRIDQPALVVRIDDVRQALPRRGLNEADVAVENLVEGGLTGLLTVRHTTIPPSVGPARPVHRH
jgi:hypothetical protein